MHIVEAAAPAASLPDLAPGLRFVRKVDGETNGVLWAVYENLTTYLYGFTTSAGYTGPAEHEMAPRAQKAAIAWCAAYVAEPVFAPAPVLEVVGAADFTAAVYGERDPDLDRDPDLGATHGRSFMDKPAPPTRNPVGEHEIDGWRIVVGDDRGGTTYQAQTFRPDGSAGEAFTGYESPGVALSDAAVWCAGHAVDDLVADDLPIKPSNFIHDDGPESDFEDESVEACPEAPDAESAGWRIFSAKLRGGKFEPVLINAATGEEADLDGAQQPADTREEAVDAGTTWAINNPTPAFITAADRVHNPSPTRPALDADMSRAADRLDRDTAELEAENSRLARENATLRQRLADIDTAQAQAAAEATRNAAEREHLGIERARLVELGKANKAAIKEIDGKLLALSADGLELVEKMGSRQLVLIPGAPVSVTRSKTESTMRSTWTHGGVDYSLEARQTHSEAGGFGWRSWVHGYETATEGYGPEREDAEREAKAIAVAVLPNAGGRRPPPQVEVPATEKPKRGRKPKAVSP